MQRSIFCIIIANHINTHTYGYYREIYGNVNHLALGLGGFTAINP